MIEGIKHDDGKLPLGLIPPEAQLAEAAILRHGAAKYGKHNWRKGLEYSRVIDAALRHIMAWIGGEDLDAESGLSHLAHARCCLGFLIAYEASGPQNDDRHRINAQDPVMPKVSGEWTAPVKLSSLSELSFEQCHLCFRTTDGKHPTSGLPTCQHCADRCASAERIAQQIRLNKIARLKCRTCGKVLSHEEGVIIGDDFKLCDECVKQDVIV